METRTKGECGSALGHLEDGELVMLCQKGEIGAFEELVARHRPKFLKMALGILRNPADAEDEIQNAFLSAYRHIGDFQQNAQFSTWMNRIVVNQCLMRLRSLRRQRRIGIDSFRLGDEPVTLELPDGSVSHEETVAWSQIRSLLMRELQRVPGALREPMILTHVQELPIQETARRLGLSAMAVKSRLCRGRRELRSRLEPHMPALRKLSAFSGQRSAKAVGLRGLAES